MSHRAVLAGDAESKFRGSEKPERSDLFGITMILEKKKPEFGE